MLVRKALSGQTQSSNLCPVQLLHTCASSSWRSSCPLFAARTHLGDVRQEFATLGISRRTPAFCCPLYSLARSRKELRQPESAYGRRGSASGLRTHHFCASAGNTPDAGNSQPLHLRQEGIDASMRHAANTCLALQDHGGPYLAADLRQDQAVRVKKHLHGPSATAR